MKQNEKNSIPACEQTDCPYAWAALDKLNALQQTVEALPKLEYNSLLHGIILWERAKKR